MFLDEIGDAPISIQTRLLRVLQEKEVLHVGGDRPIPINIRVIAATNQDIYALVQQGKFRQDLYYRLNVLLIKVPPLRERKEDIIPLINYFLDPNIWLKHAAFISREDVLALLTQYHWPGNVRQLRNVLEFLKSTPLSNTLLEDLKQLLNLNECEVETHFAMITKKACRGKEDGPTYPNMTYKKQCIEILRVLNEARSHNISSISHQKIALLLQEKMIDISLQQLKSRLEHIKKYGLVNSHIGVGTWITEKGMQYIKEID